MVMYQVLAIIYCCLALLFAFKGIFTDTSSSSDEDSLDVLPQDMLLYLPAAIQGLLYIVNMREVDKVISDTSVREEQIMLIPTSRATSYGSIRDYRASTQEARSRPVNRYADSDIEDYIKLSAAPRSGE